MDSFEGLLSEPLSLHKYSYVSDNPCDGRDPSGHGEGVAGLVIALALLATLTVIAAIQFVQTQQRIRRRVSDITFTAPNPTPQQSPSPEEQPSPEPSPPPLPPRPRRRDDTAVNLDTGVAIDLVSEDDSERLRIEAYIAGREKVMCLTAIGELQTIVNKYGGPLEVASANRLLHFVTPELDNPSPRARALRPTGNLGINDIIILGTGDSLGLVTLTTDTRAVSAARAQGVSFRHMPFYPVNLVNK